GSRSISLSKCGVAFSSDIPTATANISAQVTVNGVDLVWTQDPAFTASEYSLFRGVSGNSFNLIGKTAALTFTDPEYSTEGNLCYRISYVDACDNLSPPSIDACPIRLSGNLLSDNSIDLSWSDYTGWENGVLEYTIEKYDQNGNLISSTSTGTTTTFNDNVQDLNNQIYVYVIYATATDVGVIESISNTITIIKEPKLYYPGAFTPNGDGLNDQFTVIGQYVAKFDMKIFNRWGELIFSTTDLLKGWNGEFNGQPQPEGTYTFTATLRDKTGKSHKRDGSVMLLRKK
ncbi:MAG TPA: gliding motility-associated C-terminal domain-containing protein, partial [Cyclobacteriaceae bacterium]|nr:gliding motility-associated C-terminal domain-containing protein [Cyclobacteriaceae bacterium]